MGPVREDHVCGERARGDLARAFADEHAGDASKEAQFVIVAAAEGAEAALEIESEDHAKTLLTFKSPALPETVDGVAER